MLSGVRLLMEVEVEHDLYTKHFAKYSFKLQVRYITFKLLVSM